MLAYSKRGLTIEVHASDFTEELRCFKLGQQQKGNNNSARGLTRPVIYLISTGASAWALLAKFTHSCDHRLYTP